MGAAATYETFATAAASEAGAGSKESPASSSGRKQTSAARRAIYSSDTTEGAAVKPISTGEATTVAGGAGFRLSATGQTAYAARATTPEPKIAYATENVAEKGIRVGEVSISPTEAAEGRPTSSARPPEP